MARVFAFPNSVFFYAPFLLLLTACHVGGSYVNGLRSAATIVYRGRSGGRLGLSPFAREKKLATCHLVTYTSEMPLSARVRQSHGVGTCSISCERLQLRTGGDMNRQRSASSSCEAGCGPALQGQFQTVYFSTRSYRLRRVPTRQMQRKGLRAAPVGEWAQGPKASVHRSTHTAPPRQLSQPGERELACSGRWRVQGGG